jgi:hypothetical protein
MIKQRSRARSARRRDLGRLHGSPEVRFPQKNEGIAIDADTETGAA